MSNKKELNLDELDAVSGGVGDSRTAGLEICATDAVDLHLECLSAGAPGDVEEKAKEILDQAGQVTLLFDDNTWSIKK